MADENHDLLLDCDNKNSEDNLDILGNDNVGRDIATMPEVVMMFSDEKEMLDFYKRHAYVVGFPVQKRNSRKGDDGVMRYVTFTCNHEGQRNYATVGLLKVGTNTLDRM